MQSVPIYEPDLFDDEAIVHPYEHYREMRNMGPLVYLASTECYAISRFEEVKAALLDSAHFISGKGIALNPIINDSKLYSIITSDDPRHAEVRKIEQAPINPKELNALRKRIFTEAEDLIEGILARQEPWCDAVVDIARHLPLTIVMELGGLPPIGRQQMLHWASILFDSQGPMNIRTQQALPGLESLFTYITETIDRDSVTPGSWAARAFRLADEGVITPEIVTAILIDFIGPSLDTTIAATGNLLMNFGQNPDQWEALKRDRSKIPNAINESLRMDAPIRCFSRFVPSEVKVGGETLPAGSRVAIFYASANRDETQFAEPDRFDILRRNASEQLSFGIGTHQCIGNNLARLEITALLTAMLDRVDKIETGEPEFVVHNLLRTLKQLPVRLVRKTS